MGGLTQVLFVTEGLPFMPYSLCRARASFLGAMALLVVVPCLAGCGGSSSLAPSVAQNGFGAARFHPRRPVGWEFTTINDSSDPRFNELLAINNLGKICGFDGSGAGKDPSDGYCVPNPGTLIFQTENYPNGLDTYVTSLNNNKVYAGYYRSVHGGNFRFHREKRHLDEL